LLSLWVIGFCGLVVTITAYVIGDMMFEVLYSKPVAEARSWYDPGYFVEGMRVVD
jgi:hypothetical protein